MTNEDVSAVDQVQEAPFKVYEEKPVCSCGEGGLWTVTYPDGAILGQSWSGPTGKEHAEDVADWMNEAWDLALTAVRSAIDAQAALEKTP